VPSVVRINAKPANPACFDRFMVPTVSDMEGFSNTENSDRLKIDSAKVVGR
jgi:hypothetical protein